MVSAEILKTLVRQNLQSDTDVASASQRGRRRGQYGARNCLYIVLKTLLFSINLSPGDIKGV